MTAYVILSSDTTSVIGGPFHGPQAPQPGYAELPDDDARVVAWAAVLARGPLVAAAQVALTASDVVVTRASEEGVPVPDDWKAYRAALRAIVSGSSDATEVPDPPAKPTT